MTMKKLGLLFFTPFILSTLLILMLSILTFELIISDIIIISIILFLISGFMLVNGCLLGNAIGIIPAIMWTHLGMKDAGQWINEITLAIPVYIFYICCTVTSFVKLILDTRKNKNFNTKSSNIKMLFDCIFSIINLVLIIYAVWLCFGFIDDSSSESYNKFAGEIKIMPETTEVDKYTDLVTKHYQKRTLHNKYDVYTLTVSYDKETYLKQKEITKSSYIFQQEKYNDTQYQFTALNFVFNLLSFKHYKLSYPQKIMFVGTSDKDCAITYIYFSGNEFNYINQPLSEFLINTCKWQK